VGRRLAVNAGVQEGFAARGFDDPAVLAVTTVDGARRLA
jgi:hypothetical protein